MFKTIILIIATLCIFHEHTYTGSDRVKCNILFSINIEKDAIV